MNRTEPLVLGIETSCDETGIGIVRGRTLLSNTIASSMDEPARYGGVGPRHPATRRRSAFRAASACPKTWRDTATTSRSRG